MSDRETDEKEKKDGGNFTDIVGTYLQDEIEATEAETFADLLESYSAGVEGEARVGDKVRGEIISIGMDGVFVNTGTKIDGVVDKAELLDENGDFPYEMGDELELYVVSATESEIRLSRALSGIGGLNLLQDAYADRIPVEGRVVEQCKGGFHVEICQRRAFCPVSQIDVKYVETPEDYVGQVHSFAITTFEENGRNIVVSRRTLLEREQREARKKFLETMKAGDVLDGRVVRLMPYGAFVELTPGLEGMVHISELSWSRVEKPEEAVRPDDSIRVKILAIEAGKTPDQPKISLSIKQLTGDPWDDEEERFRPGDKVRGKVVRLANFGAFVEIAPGIDGLVHISEMSYKKRVNRPEEIVKQGDAVDVTVKEVDLARRRISLSIRDAEGDPWVGVRDGYPVGKVVEGTVEKKEKFGIFVTLEPGVTGLLPKSKISKSSKPAEIEKLREGDSLTVVVEEVHPDRRKITLGPGDSRDEGDWKKYSGAAGALGSLGEQLQRALDSKKK